MSEPSWSQDPQEEAVPKCPECGVLATSHPAGRCLDRWVHTAFLGRTLTLHEQPPPYSTTPRHPALENVINAPLWPEAFAVMQTSLGCTVGRKVAGSIDYQHYRIVAAADSLPLCVCRASLCASPPGDTALEIK